MSDVLTVVYRAYHQIEKYDGVEVTLTDKFTCLVVSISSMVCSSLQTNFCFCN